MFYSVIKGKFGAAFTCGWSALFIVVYYAKLAVIYPDGEVVAAIKKADEYRGEYDVTLYEKPKKIGKLFGKLEDSGFYGCLILDESNDIKVLQK